VVESFKSMPLLMRFITGHALLCFFFLLKASIPQMGGDFSYKGQIMGFQEIWQNGLGVYLLLLGSAFPLSGVLMLRKWQYSRQLYSVVLLSAFIVPNANSDSLVYLPLALIIPCLLITYLFKYSKVRQYYGT
jgi:hypothetical protein